MLRFHTPLTIASRHTGRAAFTLLELLTVVVTVAILCTMMIPLFGSARGRADRGSCANNLKGLYVAAGAYVQDQGKWPQHGTIGMGSPEYAQKWIRTLEPYGIGPVNWTCPTIRRKLGPTGSGRDARIDYVATPFDDHPLTPYKWSTQPWFIETSDSHGGGNLLIFSTGEVKTLSEVLKGRAR